MAKNATATITADQKAEATKQQTALLEGLKEQGTGFLKVCRALYHMNAHKMYKALGFKSWREYVEGKTVAIGFTQSKGYVRVGRMLAFGDVRYVDMVLTKDLTADCKWGISVTDAEFVKAGYASMLEISRLAATAEDFAANIDDIVEYITARAKGDYTYAKLKAEIDEALKKESKGDGEGSDDSDGEETEETAETEYPEWKREVLAMVAKADSFGALMADLAAMSDKTPKAATASASVH